MAEGLPGREFERIPIKHEAFDLNAGPVDIELANHELRIVVPERDLRERWNVDCLVIDPRAYSPKEHRGFKGLRDGEEIILGRRHNQSRFDFSSYVSARHVMLSRRSSQIIIHDLGSTNGTYLLTPIEGYETTNQTVAKHEVLPSEAQDKAPGLAGFSIPSDDHPERNEDAYFIDETSKALGVFDGVGGVKGSETASRLASKVVAENLRKVFTKVPRSLGHMAMYEALWAGHEAILDKTPDTEIATTAIVAKAFETETGSSYIVVANAGDCRAYLFREGQLAHLTLDHAYRVPGHKDDDVKHLQDTLASATDLSQLDEQARRAFLNRNIITSYLGGRNKPPIITVSDFEARQGDTLVITSDGIHDNLTTDEIESIVRDQNTANLVAKALVNAAHHRARTQHLRAKRDDMTAAVLSV